MSKSLDFELGYSWSKGQIPGSKLDINPKNDEDFLGLIEFLLEFNAVSLTNLSLLKEFLITVGHHDLLQSLKQVELQISLSGILEGYIKSMIHLRHGTPVKLARDQANIAKFLLTIKEIDEELISPVLNRQLEQVEDDNAILQDFESSLLKISSLSWSKFTSYLVLIGEFYASFSRPYTQLPDVADGHFTSLFSDTKTCELLTEWMLKNGGLEAFQEFIKEKQQTTISESVSSSNGECLKEIIERLGNRINEGISLRKYEMMNM